MPLSRCGRRNDFPRRPEAGALSFRSRAYGGGVAFLFAWARMMVIQTGSIALQALLIGDYVSDMLHLGRFSPSIYAGLVVLLTYGGWNEAVYLSSEVKGRRQNTTRGKEMWRDPSWCPSILSRPFSSAQSAPSCYVPA